MNRLRIEDKYFLTEKQFIYLKKLFSFICYEDKNVQNPYSVHSEYWDTKDHEFYSQKIDGEFDHIKIRKRWYGDSIDSFFEIKYKKNFMQLKKKITHSEINSLSKLWENKPLSPKCIVSYDRYAYELINNQKRIRITFDQNINVNFNHSQVYKLPFNKKILMELKYSKDLPHFIEKELKKMELKKVPFSKYAAAIDFLNSMI